MNDMFVSVVPSLRISAKCSVNACTTDEPSGNGVVNSGADLHADALYDNYPTPDPLACAGYIAEGAPCRSKHRRPRFVCTLD